MLQAWFLRSYGTYSIWKLRENFQVFQLNNHIESFYSYVMAIEIGFFTPLQHDVSFLNVLNSYANIYWQWKSWMPISYYILLLHSYTTQSVVLDHSFSAPLLVLSAKLSYTQQIANKVYSNCSGVEKTSWHVIYIS